MSDLIEPSSDPLDALRGAAVAAIPIELAGQRVLELGIGAGATTRRLIAAHPKAEVVGLDSSGAMVFAARELGIEVQLARMEDPLPDGPWDLVIAVLAVQCLDQTQIKALIRRVRGHSRALVIGDRFDDGEQSVSLSAAALARSCDGALDWRDGSLAVVSATY